MPIYEENPFCSRRIKPGAIPFYFQDGESMDTLLALLEKNAWCGEIVGPHGSGKSTLLAALLPEITSHGKRPLHLELQDGTRNLPVAGPDLAALDKNAVLAIDGYEQLSARTRRKLRARQKAQGFGLVIIAHETYDYPDLYRTSVDLEVAKILVAKLLHNTLVQISDEIIEEKFREQGGNVREMMFSLYDVYESVSRQMHHNRVAEDVPAGGERAPDGTAPPQ